MEFESERLPTNLNINQCSTLFSFDLNFDSLKQFLDKTSTIINQHAELINALQVELEQRPKNNVLPEQLAIISEGGKIMNSEYEAEIFKQTANSLKEEKSTSELINYSNKIYNKLTCLGYAVAQNFSQRGSFPARFEKIEVELEKKAVDEKVKEKRKKLKEKVFTTIQDTQNMLEKQIKDLDLKYNEKVTLMKEEMENLEKKTFWKMHECEEMLKKKITEEYVDDSCKFLEDRIKRDIAAINESSNEKNDKFTIEILHRMSLLEDQQTEKNRVTKKQIKDIEEYCQTTFAKESLVEKFKKGTVSQLEVLQKRYCEIEKSVQIQPIIQKQDFQIKGMEDKIKDIQDKLSARINEVVGHISSINRIKDGEQSETLSLGIDQHKLCYIEINLLKTTNELKLQQNAFEDFKRSLKIRMDGMETNLYNASISFGGKEKEQRDVPTYIIEDIEDLKFQVKSMKVKQEEKDLKVDEEAEQQKYDIQLQIESIKQTEKILSQALKNLESNQSRKSIQTHPCADDSVNGAYTVEEQMNINSQQIQQCRKDLDSIFLIQKKMSQAIQSNSVGQSILSVKKLTPIKKLNCISCGVNKQPNSTQNSHASLAPQSRSMTPGLMKQIYGTDSWKSQMNSKQDKTSQQVGNQTMHS